MSNIKRNPPVKRKEVDIDFMARVMRSLLDDGTSYNGNDLNKLTSKLFGKMRNETFYAVIAYAVKAGYIEKVGRTRGTSYFSRLKPMLSEKHEAFIAAAQGKPIPEPKGNVPEVKAPAAPEAPGVFKFPGFPNTNPEDEPKTSNGTKLSNVWSGQKIVTDQDGNQWLVLTHKILLAGVK